MIRMIEGLPGNVIGFEAVGEVDAGDYHNVLDPAVDAALTSHDKLRLLYILGDEFEGYSVGAMWEDAKVGIGHWSAWERIAVVTDNTWIIDGVKAFGWMMPGRIKVFPVAQLGDAKRWLD